MNLIKKMWDKHPLAVIIVSAIFFRLISVLFAKGYGMSDDHFLVLEWAQNWLDGEKINKSKPAGHSLIYPGLHYLLLVTFQKINLYKPDLIMYVVRFLHAALSMITVYYGYKIVLFRYNKKIAAETGLLMAIFWLFPFMSVRNLIEMVCIPFIMIASYYLVKYDNQKQLRLAFLAGLFLGLSFIFRYQTNLFIVGFVAILLLRKDFIAAVLVSGGFAVSSFLIQGLTDWIAYGYPFASFIHYYFYNSSNAYNYLTGGWYVYFFTLLGILIPPTSLLIIFGFLSQWKKWAILFWPTMAFLVFHSIFPNKQERFILPAVPLFIIIGIVGWKEFVEKSAFWSKHNKLHSGLWKWFWTINILLLIIVSATYSKKTRVETMNFLGSRIDVNAILLETSDREFPLMPTFYMGKKVPMYTLARGYSVDSVLIKIQNGVRPNYLVMMNQKRMEERVQKLDQICPKRKKIIEIKPSLIDQILHFLNPRHNVNQTTAIYKLENE